jgi:hypothetical protein
MFAVDDPAVVGRLCVRLGTKFEAKILDQVCVALV